MSTNEKFVVLYDNSNIFISAQAHSGRIKKYKTGIHDTLCRIKAEELISIALQNRSHKDVFKLKAYGQMSVDVIKELKNKGLEVDYESSLEKTKEKRVEKEADTQLTADGVEFIMSYSGDYKKTLILFTGDKDMMPLIKKARKYKWDVEIYAFEHSMSKEFKVELQRKENETEVKIVNLEDYFDKFTTYIKWNGTIAEETSIKLKFKDLKKFYTRLGDGKKKDILESIKSISTSTFQLPVECTHKESDSETDEIFVVTINLPLNKFKMFKTEIISSFEELKTKVGKYFESEFGKDVEISIQEFKEIESSKNTFIPIYHEYKKDKIGYKVALCKKVKDPDHLNSEIGRRCKFAHSRDELKCNICFVNGDHEEKFCNKKNNKD